MSPTRGENIVFRDVLFNLALGVFSLLIVVLMLIGEEKREEKAIPSPSMVSLYMDWKPSVDHDVDWYLSDPKGDVIWYQNKHTAYADLLRDDTGGVNESSPHGLNLEHIFIRACPEGRWTLTIHSFRADTSVPFPESVGVVIYETTKFGNTVRWSGNTQLSYQHEEKFVAQFYTDEECKVTVPEPQVPTLIRGRVVSAAYSG